MSARGLPCPGYDLLGRTGRMGVQESSAGPEGPAGVAGE
ncbi:hypothetical protein KPATCC21470_3129 [Kitasatospora purpeofusca]